MTTCPSDRPALTVGQALSAGAAYLVRHGIAAQEAQTQAEILVEEALGIRAPGLALRRNEPVDEAVVARLRRDFCRLAAGEPVQYVVGHWPFHAIELKTDRRALIPRPETEELIERILRSRQWREARAVADIGTGTGAIALALAAAARREGRAVAVTAVDLSPEALSLARENAQALGLSGAVDFVEGNGASGLAPGAFDLIASNPPYIASAEVDALPALIKDHEPRLALDGGADGLDILRQLVLDAALALRPGGRLFLEIGDDQGLSLRRLLECAGYTRVVVARDLAGHDRYAEGELP